METLVIFFVRFVFLVIFFVFVIILDICFENLLTYIFWGKHDD